MAVDPSSHSFDGYLIDLRHALSVDHSYLLDLYDVFAQEARFGRRWLDTSLSTLPKGSEILEVGGGLMLLSAELQREGYEVTALEPIGVGFSAFTELQELVVAFARHRGHAPTVLRLRVEDLDVKGSFDFAFSVNVMEHVDSVPKALIKVIDALRQPGIYRFTCPNYAFPYEPHFNIPTLFSKALTEHIFSRNIFNSSRVADPAGMWASLNWISVRTISRALAATPGGEARFDRTILRDTLLRVTADEQFASRRSSWVRGLAQLLVACGVHHMFARLPASVLPIIDCSVSRTSGLTGA